MSRPIGQLIGWSGLGFAAAAGVATSLAAIAIAAPGHGALDRQAVGGRSGDAAAARSRSELANRCFALVSVANERFVAIRGGGYRADERRGQRAAAFFLEPTGIGTFLLQDQGRRLLAGGVGAIERSERPGERAEWRIRRSATRSFGLTSTVDGRRLALEPEDGELVLAESEAAGRARFRFLPRRGCAPFPEARVSASGKPFAGTRLDGSVLGFADAHVHVSGNLRAGGRVIHGEPFHRFGIAEALGHDERDHGPNGTFDVTGNLLRHGTPVGTHDTDGWPTFTGWPTHDTITHQQVYYMWLKRAWKAGMRLIVAQAVESEAMCTLEPLKSHSCDEMATVKLAIRQLNDLQDYVDAQSGGRGRGWFRIVRRPAQARRVIERGKLAVVIGMETSSPFGCSEFLGEPQCTAAEAERALDELHRLGVRTAFIANWTDNAFAGAALFGGPQGRFVSVFETMTTGHPFATESCGEADEAEGQCNAKGLTELGRHIVRVMMEKGMLIEVDHLSQKARETVLAMAERHRYPLVSSHTNIGGEWTPEQLERLDAVGGLSSATLDPAPELVEKILRLRRQASRKPRRAVAFGTDAGSFFTLPGPREGAARTLRYPFRSYDGEVEFRRQRSGRRVFDLNTDGVAHYGLIADLIADTQREKGIGRALHSLFSSAEAYLQMWERAEKPRADHSAERPLRGVSP